MADDDQLISFEEHNSFFSFRVYITVPGVTRETVVPLIRHPDADWDDNILTEIHLGQTTQSLIRHHRETTPITRNSDIHPRLFIIVDSTDFQERGVMLVALDEYHGHDDAVRGAIEEVPDALRSMSIGNDEWWTMKQVQHDDHPKAVPMKWFTAYNLHPDEETFETAFKKLDEGLYDVHVRQDEDDEAMAVETVEDGSTSESPVGSDVGEDNAESQMPDAENEEEEEEEPVLEEEDEGDGIDFYKAFKPEDCSLDSVVDRHAAQALENKQDPNMFAVIDNNYETQGVLIVRVSPEKEMFRCKGEVAGEILKWIFINFMTWDEAEAFASA
ncbi:hypothetical protein ACHAQA_008903 [Verticillium albo-atrum]